MGDIVAARANLPAHLQAAVVDEACEEFSGGVQSGFPVISLRGSTWRVRQGGEEQVYVDDNDDAIQAVEIVLIRSNERPSKTYYEGKYKEGDTAKPQCWSANGIKPDTEVDSPVNAACQSCPMNAWGSRTTDAGQKTRACQDVRRCAVIFSHELEALSRGEKKLSELPIALLRIPPASLNPLKDYVEQKLKPKAIAPYMLATRVGFDTSVSYPKLTFKGARFLSETEFGAVEELRDSDIVRRILDTAAEHADAGTTEEGGDAASSDSNAKPEVPQPAPAPASTANTEEAHFSEEIAPAPVEPQRAAAVEEDAIAAAPPPAPAAAPEQPPKPSTKKVAAPSPKPAPVIESPETGETDFEDMLSSILD